MMNEQRDGRHPHVVAIVEKIKSEGIFDALRRDCLADVDLKPAYQNLKQKVENACAMFLSRIVWSTKLSKNHLREQMRKSLEDSGVLQAGVKRIVHQVVTPKIDLEMKPKVAKVVCEYLGLDPDDIHTEEDDVEESSYPPVPDSTIGLYPFNPLASTDVNSSTALPGFEGSDIQSSTAPPSGNGDEVAEVRFEEPPSKSDDKSSEKQDDMDISEKSDSRCTSRASTKKSMDMDCTMTSDEEEAANGADLSKGLAAYMACDEVKRNDDDMSISSSETSSKQGQATPEPSEDIKSTATNVTGGRKSGKAENGAPVVERREMKRVRTRNKKYMSDDFESIFTEKKEFLGVAYNQEYVEEEIITTDDMVCQVVIEQTVPSSKKSSPSDDDETSISSSKNTSASGQTSYNLRRSGRKRGPKEESTPANEESSSNKQIDSLKAAIDSSKAAVDSSTAAIDSSKGATMTRKALRSSKSVTSNEAESGTTAGASTITPRRYTRSSAKQHSLNAASGEESLNKSSSSTPTQDECSSQNTDHTLPSSLIVLSDICASQNRLRGTIDDKSDVTKVSGTGAVIKDDDAVTNEHNTDQPNNHDNNKAIPTADASATTTAVTNDATNIINDESRVQETQAEIYEPELHFDEMSRDVAEAAHSMQSRENATPTCEQGSSERVTESPNSPPLSPVENEPTLPSSSMVTIPLEGDDSYHSVVQSEAVTSEPHTLSFGGIDGELPPLPPELPPLPTPPQEQPAVMPPPEPEGDEEDEEEVVYHVLDEVGADDCTSAAEDVDGHSCQEQALTGDDYGEQVLEDAGEEEPSVAQSEVEEDEDDLEELERLAQRKMEILKAIELPDSVLEKSGKDGSSEEEGQISDSGDEDRFRTKKKKSKKSKKKKSKKESHKRKHHDYDDMGSSSKRSRYF